jgi:formylglycine-generating enzyme
MGRNEVSTGSDYYPGGNPDEIPEHNATVATFALDKYEVTVGRFRKFADEYDAWHVTSIPPNPQDNAGEHPIAPNTGWGRSWTPASSDLPASSTDLKAALNCSSSYQTWTDDGSGNENYPITCVSWYMALAFCIWDGGRLPTEAEWECAAAGGSYNYLYPWGSAAPDSSRANFAPGSPFVVVGSYQAGNARWGQADLAGSVWEWVFDWYSDIHYGTGGTPATCADCANAAVSLYRVERGGGWYAEPSRLRAARRDYGTASERAPYLGFRCARNP